MSHDDDDDFWHEKRKFIAIASTLKPKSRKGRARDTPPRRYDRDPSVLKNLIKAAILKDLSIDIGVLQRRLIKKHMLPVSRVTLSNMKADMRHTIKLLKDRGMIVET